MTNIFGRALVFALFAALAACSGGGNATPPAATQPRTFPGHAFQASNVTIHEIPVTVDWRGNLSYYDTTALAVSPAGVVYFGEGGGNLGAAGSPLYSYSNGAFMSTQAAYNVCTGMFTTCCNPDTICSGPGVTAIDAQSANRDDVFWSGETAAEGVPSGLIFMGANTKATAPPAPYNSMQPTDASYFLSLVTDQNGTLWDGGGGTPGAFGYPANLSSLSCDSSAGNGNVSVNCWDALWLTNGPNNHVWGFMHVEPSSSRLGWPVLPNQTTGSIVLEFASDGQVLHSYNVNGFIGGIVGGSDDALWFTNQTANSIERISATGTITSYTIPTPNSGATKITVAADGALWFIEANANSVARVDTSGHFSQFTLPTSNAGPREIAADPAGGACSPDAVWVLEANAPALAEITY